MKPCNDFFSHFKVCNLHDILFKESFVLNTGWNIVFVVDDKKVVAVSDIFNLNYNFHLTCILNWAF